MAKVPGFIEVAAHHCVELVAGQPLDAEGVATFEAAFAGACSMERFFEPLQDVATSRPDAREFGNGHSHGDLDGAPDDERAILAAARRVLAGLEVGATPSEARLTAATEAAGIEMTALFERKVAGLDACPARNGSTGYGPCDADRDGWLRDPDVREGLREGREEALAASGARPEPELEHGLFGLEVEPRDLRFQGEVGDQAVARTLAAIGHAAVHVDADGRRAEGLEALLALEASFRPGERHRTLWFPASAIDHPEGIEVGWLAVALGVSEARRAGTDA